MSAPGDIVVWLPDPFAMGTGTVVGLNEIGWIEVVWQDGELGAYTPSVIEDADRWEQRQVEQDIPLITAAGRPT